MIRVETGLGTTAWGASRRPTEGIEGTEGEAAGGPSLGEQAFRELYERTARPLRAYLRRLVGNTDLADDLLQETYLRLLRLPRAKLEAMETPEDPKTPGNCHRTAYLYRIASRLAQDHWRRANRERRDLGQPGWLGRPTRPETAAGPEPTAGAPGFHGDLARALASLAGRDRALLWLAYVEGRDHREIAGILGLASGSVRVMLFRARRRLARVLADRGLSPAG